MSFEDGDGNCELGLGCFKKRLKDEESGKWKWCKCALIMHPVVWVCPLGLGCLFGFFGTTEHPCECRTRCKRCLKGERVSAGELLCANCCHDLYHGIVRKSGKTFHKMYRSGKTIDENFRKTSLYSKISEKTVNACGRCLEELRAAKRDLYEL